VIEAADRSRPSHDELMGARAKIAPSLPLPRQLFAAGRRHAEIDHLSDSNSLHALATGSRARGGS